MGNVIISAQGVEKTYYSKKSSVQALHAIDLTVQSQEIVAVMGPSGCGKTSLAKILAGIEDCTGGYLELFGQDCSHGVSKELKQRISYIYQDHNLLPWRSVERNLSFPLEIMGRGKDPLSQAKIDEALEIVGLSDYRTCLPQELSGGMMQRVGIARALVINSDLMVMDQPFGALDAITRRKLYFDFLNIFHSSQKTIFLVTNSAEEAILFSSRIYMLDKRPGEIAKIIPIDISYEDRTPDILHDKHFMELRMQIMESVKRQLV